MKLNSYSSVTKKLQEKHSHSFYKSELQEANRPMKKGDFYYSDDNYTFYINDNTLKGSINLSPSFIGGGVLDMSKDTRGVYKFEFRKTGKIYATLNFDEGNINSLIDKLFKMMQKEMGWSDPSISESDFKKGIRLFINYSDEYYSKYYESKKLGLKR